MVSEDLIERADQNKSWLQPSLNHPFYFENENPAIHGKQFQNNTHTISLYYQDAIQEANVSENLFKQITKPLIFQLKKFDQSDDLDIYGQEFEYIDINIYGREFKKKFREQLLEEDSEHLSPFIEDGQQYRHADVIDLVFPILQPPPQLDQTGKLDLYKPLRRYQLEGIHFLIETEKSLLADEMGLGKTVQSILALRLLFHQGKIKNALIVVPKSIIGSAKKSLENDEAEGWSGHLALWAPELIVKVIEPAQWLGGLPPAGFTGNTSLDRQKDWLTPAHIYVTTYSLLRNDIAKNQFNLHQFGEGCIILDEVTNIKNPISQQSKALRKLQAKYKWGLSGTPVQNSPADLYAIFQFLHTEHFPNLNSMQFQELSPNHVMEKVDNYFLRRNKTEDLPPKYRKKIELSLDEEQRRIYKEILEKRRDRLRELIGVAEDRNVLTSIRGAITKLKGICNFSPYKNTSPKLKELINIVRNEVKAGKKILIFSQYLVEGINKIAPSLEEFRYVQLIGDMSTLERNHAVTEFRRNPEIKIFIISLMTGGLGLNLPEATTVIHFDNWWNPARMWQAEDRAHRSGQTKPVTVYSFLMKDTIEERIEQVLKQKEKIIKQMIEQKGQEIEGELNNLISLDEWRDIFDV